MWGRIRETSPTPTLHGEEEWSLIVMLHPNPKRVGGHTSCPVYAPKERNPIPLRYGDAMHTNNITKPRKRIEHHSNI